MNSFSFFIKFLSCFLLLTCKITFIRGNLHADVNNTVEEIIHAASGVYLDRDISRQSGLEKTIVVTSSNFGYMDMVRNFACFIQLQKLKLLFVAMDTKSFGNVPADLPHVKRLLYSEGSSELNEGVSKFRKGQFNDISFRKLKTVLLLMKHGYDVIFFDSDIALLEDPIPLLALKQFDYVHQLNWFCPSATEFDAMAHEANTGVYYVRTNSRTRNLFEQVIDAEKNFGKFDDQTVFWHIVKVMEAPKFVEFPHCNLTQAEQLRSTLPVVPHTSDYTYDHENKNGTLIACPLDVCLYSAGALSNDNAEISLRAELLQRNQTPIILHANWLDGHDKKVNALKRNSLWMAYDNWTCSDYHPWF